MPAKDPPAPSLSPLPADGSDLLDQPTLQADHRIPYGPDPSQFGDLWLPSLPSGQRAPLVLFFHGGWWKSEYGLGYAGAFCRALCHAGIATWSLEYRRRGRTGGGYPATFQDVARGADHAATLAAQFPLDLQRTIAAGHSAGGHLAFWLAGRQHLQPGSPLAQPFPRVPLRAVVALAGAVDLRLTLDLAGDGLFAHDRDEVLDLMGGSPADYPDRYRDGNPSDLLPLAAPQFLLQGTDDDQIPPALPTRWAALSQAQATIHRLPGAGHFDVVNPKSAHFPVVLRTFQQALGLPPSPVSS